MTDKRPVPPPPPGLAEKAKRKAAAAKSSKASKKSGAASKRKKRPPAPKLSPEELRQAEEKRAKAYRDKVDADIERRMKAAAEDVRKRVPIDKGSDVLYE